MNGLLGQLWPGKAIENFPELQCIMSVIFVGPQFNRIVFNGQSSTQFVMTFGFAMTFGNDYNL